MVGFMKHRKFQVQVQVGVVALKQFQVQVQLAVYNMKLFQVSSSSRPCSFKTLFHGLVHELAHELVHAQRVPIPLLFLLALCVCVLQWRLNGGGMIVAHVLRCAVHT